MESDLKGYFRKRNNNKRIKRIGLNILQALELFALIVVILALVTITFIIL